MPCTWLTMEEAAIYLKVHRTTVKRYIKSGKLKASRPGGRLVRICLEELQRFSNE